MSTKNKKALLLELIRDKTFATQRWVYTSARMIGVLEKILEEKRAGLIHFPEGDFKAGNLLLGALLGSAKEKEQDMGVLVTHIKTLESCFRNLKNPHNLSRGEYILATEVLAVFTTLHEEGSRAYRTFCAGVEVPYGI